ncbi:hypothetical protein GAS19_02800 [Burkholderia glumae]|uniref:hypothetical protein n=1 Tax=Burkholderia glumae TaxID=337 RepID=UPI0012974755|nr:hypothetical protein [Burkholderia glumae]QGA36709.1 hypothetical protein GAS19_02800 [Burkholderia glumae]
MKTADRGFYVRCSGQFLDALTAAAEATGQTKTDLVLRGLAKALPQYFAASVRANQPENEVQNTHIAPFLEPDLEAKRQVGRKKRPR